MYLEHFHFKEAPFSLTPNTQFFCQLPGHSEALNVILTSLGRGDGFIKVTGEVGAGKTMLCRLLLDALEPPYVTAYIPNPDLSPIGLRKALAHELGIQFSRSASQYDLHQLINERLLEQFEKGKRVVLIIDEAQTLSDKTLETLRLFTNLQTQNSHLMQIVLFGQPQLDQRLDDPDMRQLKQRIVFSYFLGPMTRRDLDAYICHRLAMAGYTHGSLFDRAALDLLYKATGGVPRLINVLCDKALMAAFGKSQRDVSKKIMRDAILDTESVTAHSGLTNSWWFYGVLSLGILLSGLYMMFHGHMRWPL